MSSGVIEFNESVINCGTVDSSKLCWFNPSYCLAVVAARAFAADGVSLKIQGLESGGRLDNLPIYSSATDDVTPTVIGPAEVLLSDADASFLGSIGLTLLCGRKNSDQAVFGTIRSIQQPQEFFDSESYTRFFREQVNISWVFVEGYFSQRIRLLVRELCPGRQDPRPIQDWLNEFIKPLQIITPQMQMQRPLSDGFIYIDSAPGLPGVNICRLSVTPQIFHQLPDASLISLRFPL
jgi:type VI secretion system protein ImpC